MIGERSAVLGALWLLVGAYGAACAADPGDAFKGDAGAKLSASSGASVDGSLLGDGSSQDEYSGTPGSDAPATDDGSVPDSPVTMTPDSSGGGAAPDAPMDSPSMVDVGVGAGCAPGAKVITLTLPMGQVTGNTGNFGTAGPVCVQLKGSVNQGWGCPNGQGRMLTMTDSLGTQGPIDGSRCSSGYTAGDASGSMALPDAPKAGADGFVYWNFAAGTVDFTSVYIY
jgi:hypothetical protein